MSSLIKLVGNILKVESFSLKNLRCHEITLQRMYIISIKAKPREFLLHAKQCNLISGVDGGYNEAGIAKKKTFLFPS